MLTATWRRLGSPAWLAVGLVMLVPSFTQAQLFPNRTIRRERPPCASEPPFNAQVRRDYFGYYPTCWSRFPAGWACPCPNPELPNLAESYRKTPFNKMRGLVGDEGMGPDEGNPDTPREGMPGTPPAETPNIPLPNGGRSPFELDPSPKPPTTTPGGDTDPATPKTPAGRPSTSSGALEMPKPPSTSPSMSYESNLRPGAMAMMPEATLASSDTSDARPDLGPLPSSPTTSPNASASSPGGNDTPSQGMTAPTQAPRRRGFLSGLFGSGNTRKR